MYTEIQKRQLLELGIENELIEMQLKNFRQGFTYAYLVKPATISDGIILLSDSEIENFIKIYNEYSKSASVVKFVPASGAASRMFKGLFEFLNDNSKLDEAKQLVQNIDKYAFKDDLENFYKEQSKSLKELSKNNQYEAIVKSILTLPGLNYGNLPKGLLKFHIYPDGARTGMEEHITEGIKYALANGNLNLHFTISPEHEQVFKFEFEKMYTKYVNENIQLNISYSFQMKSTDTIAVDIENNPLIDEEGKFVFRPGGHGALLENLNDINADLIFIKNIDNVVPDYLKHFTVRYKKALAGLLIKIKQQITDVIVYLESNNTYSEKRKNEISIFLEKYLRASAPENLDNLKYAEYVKSKLNKPIRICGMVKNAGEPGGGPFWTKNINSELTLQIIESSQVDLNSQQQKNIFNEATHFNPVDLVCSTMDYKGEKFNLLNFRDSSAGFISEKTLAGKKLRAQELPGLWNGSMAHWITLFVEVPLETFNPVKTYTDWLRKEHQPK
jgi:hypothetical protein